MSEVPYRAGEGKKGKQSIGLGEGWRRSGWTEVLDPVETRETSGAVPSLGGRGPHGRTERWHLHQLEDMMKRWRRNCLAFEGAALSVIRLWWTAERKG